jgi:hypothetical protein
MHYIRQCGSHGNFYLCQYLFFLWGGGFEQYLIVWEAVCVRGRQGHIFEDQWDPLTSLYLGQCYQLLTCPKGIHKIWSNFKNILLNYRDSVVDTSRAPLVANLREFSKKLKKFRDLSGDRKKIVHEKARDTSPLKRFCPYVCENIPYEETLLA